MLSRENVITKLNWFYSLEMSQVELYLAQSKNVNDIYMKKILQKVAEIEQTHVENIMAMIKEIGGKPTRLGETFAPLVGYSIGTIESSTGMINMLRINIALETRAMTDYKNMIFQVDNDPYLQDLLWSNLIDEDLHTGWFLTRIDEIRSN